MIGRLSGILQIKSPPHLLVDVQGVGYEVMVPMSTLYHLPDLNHPVILLIHHYIREDANVLYGFHEEKERALFRSLIKISGVGPKMALTILSGMDVNTFLKCIEYRDIDVLVRLPGVGKKTAERLIIEMSGKLRHAQGDHLGDTLGNNFGSFETTESFVHHFGQKAEHRNLSSSAVEAIDALIALGYKPQEALKAIMRVLENDKDLATPDIIRRALQSFAKV